MRAASIVAWALVWLWIPPAVADVPDLMTLQGHLRTQGGQAYDGDVAMDLALYDVAVGGTPVYSEAFAAVEVVEGRFVVIVGLGDFPDGESGLSELFAVRPKLFVTLSVNGEAELPRQPFAAGGYALQAGGLACDACVDAAHIADGSIVDTKLAADSVFGDHIAPEAVGELQLSDGAVSVTKLASGVLTAPNVGYDGAGSGLSATTVASAIDELASRPNPPNIAAVTDPGGQPVATIDPLQTFTISGSNFGANPELLVFETPLVPTGSVGPSSIQTSFGMAVPWRGFIAISVRDTTHNARSNSVLLPFSQATPWGSGKDGDAVASGAVNLHTDALAAGRTEPDAAAVQVVSLGLNSASLASPAVGFAPGDEVLLINLMGTSTAYGSVGRYEFLFIESVNGVVVTFDQAVEGIFGQVSNTDLSGQVVVMQRVPHYQDLTISGTLAPGPFDGSTGGVLAIRVAGTLTTSGSGVLSADGRGYPGGDYGDNNNEPGQHGTGVTGFGPLSTASGQQVPVTGSNGGAGGHGSSYGGCGGGGGGHATIGGTGSAGSSWQPGGAYDTLGGNPVGSADLAAGLFLGGAGGGGGDNDNSGAPGTGGAGGGILYVSAKQIVDLVASSDGASGLAGGGGCGSALGGSGAGGTIFIVSEDATLDTVTAIGAPQLLNATDCAGDGAFRPFGGNGANGRIRVDAPTLSGTSTPAPYLGP